MSVAVRYEGRSSRLLNSVDAWSDDAGVDSFLAVSSRQSARRIQGSFPLSGVARISRHVAAVGLTSSRVLRQHVGGGRWLWTTAVTVWSAAARFSTAEHKKNPR